jgi:transglutaminase-like putative cysteine protease
MGLLALLAPGSAIAIEPPDAQPSSPLLREQSRTFHLRIGIRVRASDGPIQQAVASTAIPMEWPEQQVRLIAEDTPAGQRIQTRRVGGTAEQMLLRIPRLAQGSSATAVYTYELTRWTLRLNPAAHAGFREASGGQIRPYLQASDGIESSHPEIRELAAETAQVKSDPFVRASALFALARERIGYAEGPFVGALEGLRSGQGDCEERSCLFVALCRAAEIPARLVRGPNHSWSEFALKDASGRIVWIPADPTLEREIGVSSHFFPILQKGDRFRLPELPGQPVRYLTPRCTGLGATPQVESIEEVETTSDLPDSP